MDSKRCDKQAVVEALRQSEKERQQYFQAIKEPRETRKGKRGSIWVKVGDFALGFLLSLFVCLLLGVGGWITGR